MNGDDHDNPVRAGLGDMLPRLRRFARVLSRDPHDADDLVQIAVERALLRAGQWRPGTRLDSWLFGILRNAFIDEQRSRQRSGRVFAAEAEGERVGESPLEGQVELWSVQSALMRLPAEQREAIALVLVEGLSYQEAATALEVPVGTLTSRLARGRSALQALLQESGSGVG